MKPPKINPPSNVVNFIVFRWMWLVLHGWLLFLPICHFFSFLHSYTYKLRSTSHFPYVKIKWIIGMCHHVALNLQNMLMAHIIWLWVVGLPPYYQSFILKDNGYKDQAARSSQQMADHFVVINYWILGHRNMAWVSGFTSK